MNFAERNKFDERGNILLKYGTKEFYALPAYCDMGEDKPDYLYLREEGGGFWYAEK